MVDDVDRASAQIAEELRRKLDQIRRDSVMNMSNATSCVECGEDLPGARRKHGFCLCIGCAEERERHKELHAYN